MGRDILATWCALPKTELFYYCGNTLSIMKLSLDIKEVDRSVD